MRANQDRAALIQAQRELSGAPLPEDIKDAQQKLNSQQQSVLMAIRTRDDAEGETSLRDMEDTLAVIEKFIGN